MSAIKHKQNASADKKDEKYVEQAPEIERETRFAVVMYGGISLAIYIHGVAQELYHMVRATARKKDGAYLIPAKKLRSTEPIYRKLGEALKTRFVVDILSGTSAGGLNAVFLAKALVNDSPMEFVKRFWVDEGDISALLNDAGSLNGLSGISLQKPTLGLFNSQRFYYKLLEALMKMGSREETFVSPYIHDLDLNITATDIRGLNLPLSISNKIVDEMRYKNVFQFYYRPKTSDEEDGTRNDFAQKMDPFLAFAARCTASIPPAFEAMQLKDIEPILKTDTFRDLYGNLSMNEPDWRRFYKDYLGKGDDFPLRSFGDGGYLDNKPFSYATDALLRRRADHPIDRRLIYIEPSPEHPEDKPYFTQKPDMVENILAAVLELPRQETVREDLKIIEDRNQIVNRINHILQDAFSWGNIHKNVDDKKKTNVAAWLYSLEWAKKYPMDKDVLGWYGSGYFSYLELRLECMLRNLSQAFARALGWDEHGEEEGTLHRILHSWLDRYYGKSSKDKKLSQNDVLFRLDFSFRMRKQHFLQYILNIFLRDLDDFAKDAGTDMQDVLEAYDKDTVPSLHKEDIQRVREYLLWLKREVNSIIDDAQARGRKLREWQIARKSKKLHGSLKDYATELLKVEELISKDKNAADESLLSAIESLTLAMGTHPFDDNGEKNQDPKGFLKETFDQLRKSGYAIGIINKRSKPSSRPKPQLIEKKNLKKQLSSHVEDAQLGRILKFCHQIQKCLAYYYDNFEFYDMLTFPVQFGTEAGEADFVEVIRVSPEDATRIVNEKESGRKKLAGTQLGNFGAFFKKEWRENDMLWGRLDAAEILIGELLKGPSAGMDAGDIKRENKRKEELKRVKLEFSTSMRELYLTEFAKEYPAHEDEDALLYDVPFQFILEEDLQPLDKSALYNFLSASKEGAEEPLPKVEPVNAKEPASDEMKKLKERREKLNRLEDEFLRTLGKNYDASPSDLRKSVVAAIAEERASLETEEKELTRRRDREAEATQKLATLDEAILRATGESFDAPETGKTVADAVVSLKKKNPIRYSQIMRALGTHAILDSFKLGYRTDPHFEVHPTLSSANRGARVLSKLVEGLTEKYPITRQPAGILRIVVQALTGLINLVMPKTLGNFIFENYLVWLVYVAAGILLIGALFLKEQKDVVMDIAISTLIITASLHSVVFFTRSWLERRTFKAVWLFYIVEFVAWLIAIITGFEPLARVGMVSFAITLSLHISIKAASKADNRTLQIVRWFFGFFVLAFALLIVYGGLARLGILPEWNMLSAVLDWLKNLINSK
ncbi:MAG: patatin-like protein [Chloroflexi bacterium]|nr:patatin-like protein [Chloroflexota bacterium]